MSRPSIPNEAVGEQIVKLGAQEYVLRPSWRVVQAIESRVAPLFTLAQRLTSGQIGLSDMATIIWIAATDAGKQRDPKLEQVGDGVVYEGYAPVFDPVTRFVASLIEGANPKDLGEDEEETVPADDSKSGDGSQRRATALG